MWLIQVIKKTLRKKKYVGKNDVFAQVSLAMWNIWCEMIK